MSSIGLQDSIDFTVDKDNMYREEGLTDLKVASIRKLVPIRPDGSDDDTREPIFMGSTQLMSPSGPLPIQCPLEAKTLEEAIAEFPNAMTVAVDKIIEEAKRYQQQEASRIVVPGGQSDNKIIY